MRPDRYLQSYQPHITSAREYASMDTSADAVYLLYLPLVEGECKACTANTRMERYCCTSRGDLPEEATE